MLVGTRPWYADPRVRSILDDGELLELAVQTGRGPRVTPVVFECDDAQLWCVTPRGSARAKTIRARPRVGGLIRLDGHSLVLVGRARIVDPVTVRGGPEKLLALPFAAPGYLSRNLRHAGGVAREHPAPTLPLSRVMVAIDVSSGAVLDGARLVASWGGWEPVGLLLHDEADPPEVPDLSMLPRRLRLLLADDAEVALGWQTLGGPVALPGRWRDGRVELCAAAMELVAARMTSPACVTFSRSGPALDDKYGISLTGAGAAHLADGVAVATVDCDRVTWWAGDHVQTVQLGS